MSWTANTTVYRRSWPIWSAVAWPLSKRRRCRAPRARVRRIGVLGLLAERDPEATEREAALHETLASLAWSEGPNVRIDLFLQ
jgi:hypothetical protein